MNRTLIKDALTDVAPGEEITVAGWVRTVRTSKGGFSFLAINDGSCLATIQVVADGKLSNYDSELVHLTSGCSVMATGKLVESPAKPRTRIDFPDDVFETDVPETDVPEEGQLP